VLITHITKEEKNEQKKLNIVRNESIGAQRFESLFFGLHQTAGNIVVSLRWKKLRQMRIAVLHHISHSVD
jgi:hypothetical protein